jgi:hypothetical protein
MTYAARITTGAVLLGAGLVSCNESAAPCPAETPYSVVVTVVDSVSTFNAAPGATLIVTRQDGEVEGTMVGPTAFPQLFAGDEPGTFDISVSKPSYVTWTKNDVVVAGNSCGDPVTVSLLARLVRAP